MKTSSTTNKTTKYDKAKKPKESMKIKSMNVNLLTKHKMVIIPSKCIIESIATGARQMLSK